MEVDALNFEVYWVDNRCYRRNPCKTQFEFKHHHHGPPPQSSSSSSSLGAYVEEDRYTAGRGEDQPQEDEEDLERLNYDIEELEDGGFKTRCDNIPSALFAVIIGAKGATKMRVERDTNTKIIVPRQGDKGDIVIRGRKRLDVIKARRILSEKAFQSRMKRDATHFPCFPLNSSGIVEKMVEFQALVLKECKMVHGIDDLLFNEPEKVHLTLCVLNLLDEKERRQAADLLKSVLQEGSGRKGPIKVQLKGLEIMNDDPTQVDVLYAKCVSKDESLQRIADLVAAKFAESGLGKPNRGEKVKLHCTIMNTRKRAEKLAQNHQHENSNSGRRPYNTRESFDASLILSKFKDFDFGSVEITEVQLATRFTTAANGFYKAFCTVPL